MLAERSGKLPKALEQEPEVFEDMLPYWEAYGDLMHSRSIGMSVGPIPLSEIVAYLTLFPGLREDLLVRMVRELDEVYLEHHNAKQKQKTHSAAPPARAPVGRKRIR